MKSMVIFYSRSGITEALAKKISLQLNCPITEVFLEKPYGGYWSAFFRVLGERCRKVVPVVKTITPDLLDVEAVFVCYPVWFGEMPSFFADFIKRCDLGGKKVIPVVTSGGGKVEASLEQLKKLCPNSEVVLPYTKIGKKITNFDSWVAQIEALR